VYSLQTHKVVELTFNFKSTTMVAKDGTPPEGHPLVRDDGELRFVSDAP
jgi:hypothetical protein